ncbi:MAG TPA: alpha/beta family hydrolase [Iamia sp.]|nr:alpha/beta family hydrolase [Iamia sp.]
MATVEALLLAPGAGADRTSPTLVAVEEAVDLPVARMDFPYRKEGRKAPDRAPKLIAAVVEEAAALATAAGVDPARIALGGRSMGGRMCSMAVAEGLPAAALVLLSYPLHPPGKPENLRVDHFPAITVPCLFVGGTKDPFGTPEEMEHHTAAIAGPVTHVWVPGNHSPKGQDPTIAATVADWLAGL